MIMDRYDWTVIDLNGTSFGWNFDKAFDLFPRYENKVKCLIKFQGVYVESKEYTVYNYFYHNYQLTVTSSSQTNQLLFPEDILTFTATLQNLNAKARSEFNNPTIEWKVKASYIKNGQTHWTDVLPLTNQNGDVEKVYSVLNSQNQAVLKIIDSENNSNMIKKNITVLSDRFMV